MYSQQFMDPMVQNPYGMNGIPGVGSEMNVASPVNSNILPNMSNPMAAMNNMSPMYGMPQYYQPSPYYYYIQPQTGYVGYPNQGQVPQGQGIPSQSSTQGQSAGQPQQQGQQQGQQPGQQQGQQSQQQQSQTSAQTQAQTSAQAQTPAPTQGQQSQGQFGFPNKIYSQYGQNANYGSNNGNNSKGKGGQSPYATNTYGYTPDYNNANANANGNYAQFNGFSGNNGNYSQFPNGPNGYYQNGQGEWN